MNQDEAHRPPSTLTNAWDTSTHDEFFKYYAEQSLSPRTLDRFRSIRDTIRRLLSPDQTTRSLDVLDVGCGAGAQSTFWLEDGHRYRGVDINQPMVELARQRADRLGIGARFDVGTATSLPVDDASMDVCLLPELLEHVEDWRSCVNEANRVLRPGGLLYLSTTNWLCPRQEEFNLPWYSWYPGPLKRYFERRAVSDWPAIANFAKYPAVNWFSFYSLRRYLRPLGYHCLDRFDLVDDARKGLLSRRLLSTVRVVPPLRLLGHMATSYTVLVGRKAGTSA